MTEQYDLCELIAEKERYKQALKDIDLVSEDMNTKRIACKVLAGEES